MHEALEALDGLERRFAEDLAAAKSEAELEQVRIRYLGRKGEIQAQFKRIGELPPELKGEFGQQLNRIKNSASEKLEAAQSGQEQRGSVEGVDPTLPARPLHRGTLHPLTLIERRLRSIFTRMGFTVEWGPEIEDTWHNFDALNTPEWHPARDKSDTLYLEGHDDLLLRTETSGIQIRTMQKRKPPIRIVGPGRTFRNDKPDATHSPMFTQVEGLYVDEGVDFADLKGTVLEFFRHLFGAEVRTRFRPHFFPFTEPSAEVDVSCPFCGGTGCRVCKNSGWIEMGGSGMVDPNVFEAVGVDPERYTGWAFGLGVERIAMLLYGVDDIRLFYQNDLRFLKQFGGRR